MNTEEEWPDEEREWDDGPVPQRSRLYSLPVRGVGTGDCESFRSYFWELAYEHRVKPRALYLKLIQPALEQKGYRAAGHGMLTCAKPQVFPEAVAYAQIVNALAELTGVKEIVGASLISISSNFSPVRLTAPVVRYCPLCLRTHVPYERAMWAFAAVKSCAVHRVRLVEPCCEAPEEDRLKPSQVVLKTGVCNRCGSVGCRCSNPYIQEASDEEHWVATQFAELVAFVSSGGKIDQRTLRGGVAACIKWAGGGQKLSDLCNFPSGVLVGLERGSGAKAALPLQTTLAIASVRKISLVSLIRGEFRFDVSAPNIEAPRYEHRGPLDSRVYEFIRVLEHGLKILPTTSLAAVDVADMLNLTKTEFPEKFPACWTAFKEKHQAFISQRQAVAQELLKRHIRGKIEQMAKSGVKITESALISEFSHAEYGYAELRTAVRDILVEAGFRPK
ncbi:TniQ family protein [Cupriavidus metallidurans]|uniref:TniQ family protein n=1 Tax=Cupriavidus metallidurans TaxID=119219 RepID=UPI0009B8BD91|nr:TniQ family protein [Cupriavidus metallidurans]